MSSLEKRLAKLEAEKRVAGDIWLANRIGLSALGQPYPPGANLAAPLWQQFSGASLIAQRRYRPRGTWKKLRGCRCR